MQIIDHIAAYLSGVLPATSGIMHDEPDRCATVYATGVRPRSDDEGSRIQIIVRSERDVDTALGDAMTIADMLDDFSGVLNIDSPYFARISMEGGVAALGADENRRLMYSINLRAWTC